MDKSLSEKFLKFIQDLNSVAPCDLFINIDLNLLRKIESLSRCDDNLDIQLKRLSKLLDQVTLDFSQIHLQINQLYWEIIVYYYLKYKNGICVKKVQENAGTLDYEISFEGQLFGLEVKTPAMADALTKYKEYQEEALNAKIQAEEEAKKKKVGFSARVIQPYLKLKNEFKYSPYSPKLVIEILTEKIEQNFKLKQFKAEYSKRILCVVLDQLPLLSKPEEASVPVYPCFYSKSCVSGELWYVAFGKKGMLIFKPTEWEGKGNVDGILEKMVF
ncbi:MAG: hypothetical protein Q9M37_01695 [Desulfonauticus sp.]|nr:hypothetical protein [Desulfonauticus sp.]